MDITERLFDYGIPCGEDWLDCCYFDPDVCLQGECVIADSLYWEDDECREDDSHLTQVLLTYVQNVV